MRTTRETPRQRRARERRDAWNAEARKRCEEHDFDMAKWDAGEIMWEYDNLPRATRDYLKDHDE